MCVCIHVWDMKCMHSIQTPNLAIESHQQDVQPNNSNVNILKNDHFSLEPSISSAEVSLWPFLMGIVYMRKYKET